MRRWDREKFPNQDSNLGRLKSSGTICQHTAHETIGASLLGCPIETSIRHYFSILLLSICQLSKQCTFPPTDILHVFTMFSLEMLAQQLGNHKLFTKALVFPGPELSFLQWKWTLAGNPDPNQNHVRGKGVPNRDEQSNTNHKKFKCC